METAVSLLMSAPLQLGNGGAPGPERRHRRRRSGVSVAPGQLSREHYPCVGATWRGWNRPHRTQRRNSMFMNATRMLAVLAVAALFGCGSGSPARAPDADRMQPPYGPGLEVGRTYDYVLLTHCGIIQTQIDGTMWLADPPLDVSG